MALFDHWRSFRSRFDRQLRLVTGRDRLLKDVLLEVNADDCLHIDYLFPIRKGVMFVDLCDYVGHIFGAESIRQWTILDRGRRHVLDNPLFTHQSKRETLRELLTMVSEVEGRLVFPDTVTFGSDVPPMAVRACDFFTRLEDEIGKGGDAPSPGVWTEVVATLARGAP